ncbi:MAG: AAA family ATPase, partial [Gammaproteobacteria bacterium]|nr:AAA family ATPase [Gammaproteobacteria bacterium]
MKRKIVTFLSKWQQQTRRKPLILKGARQVGKTYLLKEFGQSQFSSYHYFDFEKQRDLAKVFQQDLNPQRIINELSFYARKAIDIKHDLVIFDEIQACPSALTSLKYFCEEMPELALCSAGSLLGIHLNSDSYPVGKVEELSLYPLSFSEFLQAVGDEKSLQYVDNLSQSSMPEIVHDHLCQQLKNFFIVGGLPELVVNYRDAIAKENSPVNLLNIFDEIRTKQEVLIKAYFADMAKHAGKVNAMHLDRIWHAAATQLAEVQDATSSRFRFKGVIPGIDRYSRLASAIDWLEGAGIIIKSSVITDAYLPLAAYAKEGFFKLFIFDVGILGAMLNLAPASIIKYEYGTFKGYFAENFVAQELRSAGLAKLYAWQGRHAEVEFVCEVNGKLIPIEVKSGNITHAKSLKSFIDRYHPEF